MGMFFFEVFDQLCDLPKDLDNLFKEVYVEKVSVSKIRAEIKIYIESNRLIQRAYIKKMEYQLKKQLFPGLRDTVLLWERYHLSAQYTPQNLFEIYKESLLEEFRENSILEYNLFELAEISFEDNVMVFRCAENFLVRKLSQNVKTKLTDIFKNRFDCDVNVRFEYFELESKEEEEEYQYEFVKAADKNAYSESVSDFTKSELAQGNSQDTLQKLDSNTQEKSSKEVMVKEVKEDIKPSKSTYEKGKYNYKKNINDPDTIYGKGFEGESIPIADIQDEIGEVVIRGKLLGIETRELRNEKSILIFTITDFTDSIQGKLFMKTEEVPQILEVLKKGKFVKLKGMALMDKYDREIAIGSIVGIKTISDFTTKKMDNSPEKRVELHAHTMMSDMDAVVDVKDLVKRAFEWGHKAVAITDHGVVQSFPEANHTLSKKDYPESEWERMKEFKIIYGVEAYLVDDLKEIVVNEKGQSLEGDFIVFDIETTGFGPVKDRIIEIGAVKVSKGEVVDKFSTFINPEIPIPYEIEELTGIRDEMVMESPTIDVILPQFLEFCGNCTLVAHNASFDVSFITKKAEFLGIHTDFTVIDTVGLARILLPELNRYKLNVVAQGS